MKTIKKISGLILFAVYILLSSCEKSEPDITTADRDKFIATWATVSTGSGGQRNFNMVITASNSAPDQIKMTDFDGGGSSSIVFANISGNSLSIVPVSISGEAISGTGSLSSDGKKLTLNFTLDDGQNVEQRTSIGDKIP